MEEQFVVAVDVGTGSVRAAVVDGALIPHVGHFKPAYEYHALPRVDNSLITS